MGKQRKDGKDYIYLILIIVLVFFLIRGCINLRRTDQLKVDTIKADTNLSEGNMLSGDYQRLLRKKIEAFDETNHYYGLAEDYFDKSSASMDIKDWKNCVKYCEESRLNAEIGNKIARELKSYLIYEDDLMLLYKQIIEHSLEARKHQHEACEYFERACRNWEVGLWEKGYRNIENANEHIFAYDEEVRIIKNLEGQQSYIFDKVYKKGWEEIYGREITELELQELKNRYNN